MKKEETEYQNRIVQARNTNLNLVLVAPKPRRKRLLKTFRRKTLRTFTLPGVERGMKNQIAARNITEARAIMKQADDLRDLVEIPRWFFE